MDKTEFGVLVKAMKAVYSEPKFIPDKDAFEVWYKLLKDLDYDMASMSISKYMLTNRFPPSIADIRTQYSDISNTKENELYETTAWGMVLKAMRNSTYNSEYEFNKLPEIIKKSIGSANQLREWAIMEDMDGRSLTVLQSNFMRTFRAMIDREKELKKLNPELLKVVEDNYEQPKIVSTYKETLSVSEERKKIEENRAPYTKRIEDMIKKSKEKLKSNNL